MARPPKKPGNPAASQLPGPRLRPPRPRPAPSPRPAEGCAGGRGGPGGAPAEERTRSPRPPSLRSPTSRSSPSSSRWPRPRRRPGRAPATRASPAPIRCRLHGRGERHPLLSREEEHRARPALPRQRGPGRRGYRLVAANLRLVVKLAHEYHRNPSRAARPGPGGQHRADAGGEEVRPRPRGEALQLRRLVDPRVHPSLHHGQLEDGEAGDHRGPAEALLQAAPGAGAPAQRRASRRRPSCWPSGSTSPSRTWWRWTSGSATTRCRIDAPVGEDGDGTRGRPHPALQRLPRRRRAAGDRGAEAALPGEARRSSRKTLDGQGAVHLREAPDRRRADDAAGDRRRTSASPASGPGRSRRRWWTGCASSCGRRCRTSI